MVCHPIPKASIESAKSLKAFWNKAGSRPGFINRFPLDDQLGLPLMALRWR
jgi:hypothetical protein